jgi:hypothetical protein
MVMLGVPAAFACSIFAMAGGTERIIAIAALVLSSLELVGLAVLFVMAFLLFVT